MVKMGNNGSRTGHITSLDTEPTPTWTQSFPKNSHGLCQQHKVLPEKGFNKKLRSTNNGEILYSGGTISGRQFQEKTLSLERENKPFKIFRTNSVSSNPSDDLHEYNAKPYTRSYLAHHGGVIRYAAQRFENNNIYKEQLKKYGSEPDLRNHSSPNDRNDSARYKGKKKYRAPPPPNHGVTRSDPDGAVSSTASSPVSAERRVAHSTRTSEEFAEKSVKKPNQLEMSDECMKKTQMTLVLSEYRQSQREYKDFRGSPRYMGEFLESHNTKQTTIHPQVTYNIPKASNAQQGCSNYRKQFAHGVKSSRSGDSSYSDDSQSVKRNNSPKICLNKRMPVSRF